MYFQTHTRPLSSSETTPIAVSNSSSGGNGKKAGKHAQGTICYTTSPVHTEKLFVKQAKALKKMGADSIAIKDMAGLLTPYATYDLIKAIKGAVDLPVFIHSHATAGLAAQCQLKAIEAGAEHIDTAISAFAWGTSHPATESQVAALRGTKWDTGLDLELLGEIADYKAEFETIFNGYVENLLPNEELV